MEQIGNGKRQDDQKLLILLAFDSAAAALRYAPHCQFPLLSGLLLINSEEDSLKFNCSVNIIQVVEDASKLFVLSAHSLSLSLTPASTRVFIYGDKDAEDIIHAS